VADGGKSMSQHSQLGRSSSIQTPSSKDDFVTSLPRYATECSSTKSYSDCSNLLLA
jgi:hypothetical protein